MRRCQLQITAIEGPVYPATRYTRPLPSTFSEVTSMPSFFLSAPAIAPRSSRDGTSGDSATIRFLNRKPLPASRKIR